MTEFVMVVFMLAGSHFNVGAKSFTGADACFEARDALIADFQKIGAPKGSWHVECVDSKVVLPYGFTKGSDI